MPIKLPIIKKMGYGLNRNQLYYMEPADRIELSTY